MRGMPDQPQFASYVPVAIIYYESSFILSSQKSLSVLFNLVFNRLILFEQKTYLSVSIKNYMVEL